MTNFTQNDLFFGALDMSDLGAPLGFAALNTAIVGVHTAIKCTLVLSSTLSWEFTGVDLTYDNQRHLTGGIVTGMRAIDTSTIPATNHLTFTGFSMSATALQSAITGGNASNALEKLLFSGNDTIQAGDGDDVLLGYGGSDTISGGRGNDAFLVTSGKVDLLRGDDGDDSFYFGRSFGKGDIVQGGAGFDTMYFDGDYSGRHVVNTAQISGVEQLIFVPGSNYNFQFTGGLALGGSVRVDGSFLGAADSLFFTDTEGSGQLTLVAGPGQTVFRTGSTFDTFELANAISFKAVAGGGDDTFYVGGNLAIGDRVDGGSGNDTLFLEGNYSAGLTLGRYTVQNISNLILGGGFSYKLTFGDSNIGKPMTVDASQLRLHDVLTFNAAKEPLFGVSIIAGAANDSLTGGNGADTFDLSWGGNDKVVGNGGDDTVFVGNALTPAELIDGGVGTNDSVVLEGPTFAAEFTFTSTTIKNVERVTLTAGDDYNLVFSNTNAAVGTVFTVAGSTLGLDDTMTIDVSAEKEATVVIQAGGGDDIIIGGNGLANNLSGGGGADRIAGSATAVDTFIYNSQIDSMGTAYDTLSRFDASVDHIDLVNFGINGASTVTIDGSTVNAATLTENFTTLLTSSVLGASKAILFAPQFGDLAGKTFVVIDTGSAGYQAGQDMVILLNNATHLESFGITTFI